MRDFLLTMKYLYTGKYTLVDYIELLSVTRTAPKTPFAEERAPAVNHKMSMVQ
jgi:hypothetical protein